jgi:ubiquitin-like-conjugating enzyme ATG3
MFDGLKKFSRDVISKIKKTPTSSKFIEKGVLTPQEFIEAGDKLIYVNPMWEWGKASSSKLVNKDFPEEKQYLTAEIKSWKRMKDIVDDDYVEIENNEDGWNTMKYKKNDVEILEVKEEKIENEKKIENNNVINLEDALESDSDEEEQAEIEKKKENLKTIKESDKNLRIYRVYITYDLYYNTPRFWLSGVDYKNQPLNKEQIFEEIMSEYKDKTVTVENHPHLNVPMVFIHPCRHADVVKTLVAQAMESGKEIKVEQYMFIFLKFISSVMPGLEMDYTTEVEF